METYQYCRRESGGKRLRFEKKYFQSHIVYEQRQQQQHEDDRLTDIDRNQ